MESADKPKRRAISRQSTQSKGVSVSRVRKPITRKNTTLNKPKATKRITKSTGVSVNKPKLKPPPNKQKTKITHVSPLGELPSKTYAPHSEQEEVTLLTGSLSLRLQEKRVLYTNWYLKQAPKYMSRIAYGFGYFFIISGLVTAFAVSTTWSELDRALLASIYCSSTTNASSSECFSTDNDTLSSESQTITPTPEVEFYPIPTVEIGRDIEVKIQFLYTAKEVTLLRSLYTGHVIDLKSVHRSNDGIATYLLPTSDLPAGEYQIITKVVGIDSITRSEYLGPTLVVPLPPTNTVTDSATDEVPPETSLNTMVENEPISTVETEINEYIEEDLISGDEILDDETYKSNDMTEQILTEPKYELKREPEPVSIVEEPVTTTSDMASSTKLDLTLTSGVLPSQYRLEIQSAAIFDVLEVYARSTNSTVPLFLGVATRTRFGWLYWLDTTSLPAGTYRVGVKALVNRVVKEEAAIFLTVAPKSKEYLLSPEYEVERERVVASSTPVTLVNSSTTVSLTEVPLPTLLPPLNITSTTEVGREKVEEIIENHEADLNELLTRYATALQSDDETIQRLAESALNEKLYTLIAREVVQSDFEPAAYEIEQALRNRINTVKERISQVQELRRERTASASSIDSDGDGVTDHDEYLLYQTDPNSPDTDGDGVTDGIEIVTGFDPLSAAPEAVVLFHPPQEVEYIDDALLGITEVAPLLLYSDEKQPPFIQSEITGYGLPNSFVTLYIYSEPIVVTVRTGDDGSFSYTFTKELKDGEHAVYAALTNNNGEIVVRSTPFRFVKTAEAFTYVGDTTTSAPITTTEPTMISAPFNLAAAMGVVSFGFILLLLGYTIRHPKQPNVIHESS